MEKINKHMGLLLVIAVFLFSIVPVTATVSMVAENISILIPATAGVLHNASAAIQINWSETYNDQNWNQTNIYLHSVSTANTTKINITSIYNTSLNNLNGSLDTTVVQDSNDYTLTFQLTNGTAFINKTITGITIDNSIPFAPTIIAPTDNSKDTDGTFVFSVDTDSNTGNQTTGCTLYFDGRNPGASSYSMTHSGPTCNYSATAISEETYRWYAIATDGTNTTTSSTWSVHIESKKSAAKVPALLQEPGVTSKGGALLSFVNGTVGGIPVYAMIIIVIAIIGTIWYMKKK